MGSGKGKNRRANTIEANGDTSTIKEEKWDGQLPEQGVYLDDRHSPVKEGWRWTKSVVETTMILEKEEVGFVSLDYELGLADPGHNGAEVIEWMIENSKWPQKLLLHTGSYDGRGYMQQLLKDHAPYQVVMESPIGPLYSLE